MSDVSPLPPGFELDAPSTASPLKITVTPKQTTNSVPPPPGFELDSPSQPSYGKPPSWSEDVLKAIPSGMVRGVSGLLGLPGEAGQWMKKGADWLSGSPSPELPGPFGLQSTPATSEQITRGIESVTGPLYDPQTTPGKYASTVASFVPGALVGPGGPVRNLVNFAAIPGVASEAAGQVTAGTSAEPWARAGAGIVAGGAASVLNRPSPVAGTLSKATRGVTKQQFEEANRLFNDAQASGTPISRFEALQAVTGGGTQLGNVQRVVEGSGGMGEFYAARPQQVEAAGRQALDTISPAPVNPYMVGPAAGASAESIVRDVEKARTNATSPFYKSAATDQIPQSKMDQFIAGLDQAIAEDKTGIVGSKLSEIRSLLTETRGQPGTPAQRIASEKPSGSIYTTIPGKPPVQEKIITDIENIDRVRKYIRDKVNMPQIGLDAITKEQGASIIGQLDNLKSEMISSSPSFAAGKQLHEDITQRYVEPLMQGPIGKIAARDTTTRKAIDTLFPRNPLPNSQDEIATAVSALAHRNPDNARELVRTYAESVFNQATRDLQGGPNQWGGAGFAAAIRGNPQQAANLEAALRALPNGDNTWTGFNRFLQIMEAQGQRQRIGSQTDFNTVMRQELQRGTPIGEAVTIAAGVGMKLPSRIKEGFERLRLGRSVEELARLATDPGAVKMFDRLATSTTAGQASAVFLQIGNVVAQAIPKKQKKTK